MLPATIFTMFGIGIGTVININDKCEIEENHKVLFYLRIYMKKYFCFFFVILMVFLIITTNHVQSKKFSAEKWRSFPEKRYKITSDLIKNHNVIGMEKEKLIKTLGNDFLKEGTFFSEKIHHTKFYYENNIVYYIGEDLLESLYIIFHVENNIIIGYTYGAK